MGGPAHLRGPLLIRIRQALTRHRDESDPAAKGHVSPQPIDRCREAISNADQKTQVNETPEPPGWCTPQLHPAKVRNCGFSSYRGKTSPVAISESGRGKPRFDSGFDDSCYIGAALFRRGRETRYGVPVPAATQSGIANGKCIRDLGDRQIGIYRDPARFVRLEFKPPSGRRCRDSGRPKHGPSRNDGAVDRSSFSIDTLHATAEPHVDAQSFE